MLGGELGSLERLLGGGDHLQGAGADPLQGAGGGDAVAERLGTCGVEGLEVRVADARIALRRLDQRQRHRAVEQVGAARLAGPLRRAADVEDVVEQLEGEPDAGAEAAQRLVVATEQTGAFEQAPGLQPAAGQVALLADAEVEGVLALGELPLSEGDRGIREKADRAGVAGLGEQGEGA